MKGKVSTIGELIKKGFSQEAYAEFSEQLRSISEQESEMADLILAHPELLNSYLPEFDVGNISHVGNLCCILQTAKKQNEQGFYRLVSSLDCDKDVFRLVWADTTSGFRMNLKPDTIHDLIGYQKTCDIAAWMLQRVGSFSDPSGQMAIFRRVGVDRMSAHFPVIDYLQKKAPGLRSEWDKYRRKASSFIGKTENLLPEITHQNIDQMLKEFFQPDIILGVAVARNERKVDCRITSSDVYKDLIHAKEVQKRGNRFIIADPIGDTHFGPLATAQFIKSAIDTASEFKASEIRHVINNSESFPHQLKDLQADDARKIIAIDHGNTFFHKIKWSDRKVMRDMISEGLGL